MKYSLPTLELAAGSRTVVTPVLVYETEYLSVVRSIVGPAELSTVWSFVRPPFRRMRLDGPFPMFMSPAAIKVRLLSVDPTTTGPTCPPFVMPLLTPVAHINLFSVSLRTRVWPSVPISSGNM